MGVGRTACADGPPEGAEPPPRRARGRLGGALARWWRGLAQPLAADGAQARFWVRHLRIGVVLTVLSALLVLLYALLTPERPHRPLFAVVALAAAAASPLMLRLPMDRMALDHRGRRFFYAWSVVVIALVTTMAAIDGGPAGHGHRGGASMLWLLYVLALIYATVAYPPRGVAALGAAVVAAVVTTSLASGSSAAEVWVPAAMLAVFSAMACWSSLNLHELQAQQERTARELRVLASTDGLTGCLNRRAFLERLQVGIDAPDPVSTLLLIDLDGFKGVNDTAGHAAGDALLVDVARAVERAAGDVDGVARLGGDEFAVLCRRRDEAAGRLLAERVAQEVAAAGAAHGVTASVGRTLLRAGDTPASALQRADRSMYRAKAALRGDRRTRTR